jgi:hypothetical protein
MGVTDSLREIVKRCDDIDRNLAKDAQELTRAEYTEKKLESQTLDAVFAQLRARVQLYRTRALAALNTIATGDTKFPVKNPHGKRILDLTANPPAELNGYAPDLQQDRTNFYREQIVDVIGTVRNPRRGANTVAPPAQKPAASAGFSWEGIKATVGSWFQQTPPVAADTSAKETFAHPEIRAIATLVAELDVRIQAVKAEARALIG